MNTTFSKFDSADNADKYEIKKVGMAIQLVEISSNKVIDYRLLEEHILDINPAWFEHGVDFRLPFIELIVPMPEFICRHNAMIDRSENDRLNYLATMN